MEIISTVLEQDLSRCPESSAQAQILTRYLPSLKIQIVELGFVVDLAFFLCFVMYVSCSPVGTFTRHLLLLSFREIEK